MDAMPDDNNYSRADYYYHDDYHDDKRADDDYDGHAYDDDNRRAADNNYNNDDDYPRTYNYRRPAIAAACMASLASSNCPRLRRLWSVRKSEAYASDTR
jgi:hypothetical protein